MKKTVLVGVALVVVAFAGFFAFRTALAQYFSAGQASSDSSRHSADVLQAKIDNIKKTDAAHDPNHSPVEIEITDAELESYVLYSLRENIPIQLDSIDVQLTPGAVGADTQMTFTSNGTGNAVVDALIGGTHNLTVKGRLSGEDGRGKFDLDEIKVDGIPMPKVLLQTLFAKYVKPKYPDADLKEPFDLPWGIRSIDIQSGKGQDHLLVKIPKSETRSYRRFPFSEFRIPNS